MAFQIGGLSIKVDTMKLFSGDGISLTINGGIGKGINLDLYVDYAPKALTVFAVRGSITQTGGDK